METAMRKTEVISVRTTLEIRGWVEAEALRRDTSVSRVVNGLLRERMKRTPATGKRRAQLQAAGG